MLTSRVFPFCNFVSLLGYNLESDGGKTTKQIRAEAKKAAAEKSHRDWPDYRVGHRGRGG